MLQLKHPVAISYTSLDPKKLRHGFLKPTYNEYERPVYKGLDVVFRVEIIHPTVESLVIATMFLYKHTLD